MVLRGGMRQGMDARIGQKIEFEGDDSDAAKNAERVVETLGESLGSAIVD
ncbi:UNVERIFIED_CONTAM: hypothetical protein Slati_0384300 [Sesamum latifolium]|uniref:Uncharacterized protein n=1 Tax=Sesamum latifolium TaxID=2727402 RepID=A0AAW2XZE0_9LAMI